jgi:hypothetical protein
MKADTRRRPIMESPTDPLSVTPQPAMPRRRSPLTAVLQARVTRSEQVILEQLARRHGITLSEAVRLGAWSYLLARGARTADAAGASVAPSRRGGTRSSGASEPLDDAVG